MKSTLTYNARNRRPEDFQFLRELPVSKRTLKYMDYFPYKS